MNKIGRKKERRKRKLTNRAQTNCTFGYLGRDYGITTGLYYFSTRRDASVRQRRSCCTCPSTARWREAGADPVLMSQIEQFSAIISKLSEGRSPDTAHSNYLDIGLRPALVSVAVDALGARSAVVAARPSAPLLAAVAPAALALVSESSDAVAATGAFTVTLHPGGRSHAG